MSQVIYLKEQVNNPILDRNNKVIPFHELGGDIGGIKLDTERDVEMIEDINKAITEKRGGAYLATEGQYADVSKKPIWRPSNPLSEPLKVFQPNRRQPVSARPEDVAAAAEPPLRQPTINPRVAADLTAPGAPLPPAESGQEPPVAPPVNLKPRVGKASIKPKTDPTAQVSTAAA